MDIVLELMNDPDIEFMTVGWSFPKSPDQQERWYEKTYLECNDPIRLMIDTEKSGTVGLVSLGGFDWKNSVAHTTGVKVKSDLIRENGVAIDAMYTMIKYGFDELNLNRIEGSYIEYNKQSQALNKLVGFKDEGRLRQAIYKKGQYWDLIITAIIKDDYLQRRKKHAAEG